MRLSLPRCWGAHRAPACSGFDAVCRGPGAIWPSQLELHWGCTVRSAHEDRSGVIFLPISSARRLCWETLDAGWHGFTWVHWGWWEDLSQVALTEVFLLLMTGSLDGLLFLCCLLGFADDFHQGTFSRDQCTCWNDVCVWLHDYREPYLNWWADRLYYLPVVCTSIYLSAFLSVVHAIYLSVCLLIVHSVIYLSVFLFTCQTNKALAVT